MSVHHTIKDFECDIKEGLRILTLTPKLSKFSSMRFDKVITIL